MGYHTDFDGDFEVTPVLLPEHRTYLEAFARSRRMKRDAEIAETLPDPIRIAARLPVGFEGAYFVGNSDKNMGQDKDISVTNSNEPPGSPKIPAADPTNPMADWNQRYAKEQELTAHALALGLAQPGLWCQWEPSEDGTAIRWDEGEKFYHYIEWIKYLIAHFIEPWGYSLNGEVNWAGEDSEDRGVIKIQDNVVTVGRAVITYHYS